MQKPMYGEKGISQQGWEVRVEVGAGDCDGEAGIFQKVLKVKGGVHERTGRGKGCAPRPHPHASQFLVFVVSRRERGAGNGS